MAYADIIFSRLSMRRTLASFDDLIVLEICILNAVGLTSEQSFMRQSQKRKLLACLAITRWLDSKSEIAGEIACIMLNRLSIYFVGSRYTIL